MKLEFKPEDFPGFEKPISYEHSLYHSMLANERLVELLPLLKQQWKEELLQDAPVVYGRIEGIRAWTVGCTDGLDTHKARLVEIEELK